MRKKKVKNKLAWRPTETRKAIRSFFLSCEFSITTFIAYVKSRSIFQYPKSIAILALRGIGTTLRTGKRVKISDSKSVKFPFTKGRNNFTADAFLAQLFSSIHG